MPSWKVQQQMLKEQEMLKEQQILEEKRLKEQQILEAKMLKEQEMVKAIILRKEQQMLEARMAIVDCNSMGAQATVGSDSLRRLPPRLQFNYITPVQDSAVQVKMGLEPLRIIRPATSKTVRMGVRGGPMQKKKVTRGNG